MAQRHTHSQPIETYGLAPHNRNLWPSAHNRNIWPYNSQAAAPPSRLADSFVLQAALNPLLMILAYWLFPMVLAYWHLLMVLAYWLLLMILAYWLFLMVLAYWH